MEETKQIQTPQHNPIVQMFSTLWARRKVFYWLWPVTFALACTLILCVPRYYTCEVILAPEAQTNGSSSSLQSMASSFGFDMRNMSNPDALYPMLYPEIVASPDFLVKLFDIPVMTGDGRFEDTYYTYLIKMHKSAFWNRWKSKLRALISREEPALVINIKKTDGVDLFNMSKWQWYAIELMQSNIKCKVDKKTDVITLSVTAQDKLVCAVVADSVCAALQTFITDYRTVKNRTDLTYYRQVMDDAQREYRQASSDYVRYVDSHHGMQLEEYRIEAQNLETEMQIKQAAYTSFQKQYLATQARLQENTPVFTVLQSASIPLKASGPRRVMFVLAVLLVVTGIAFCVICRDQLIAMITSDSDDA